MKTAENDMDRVEFRKRIMEANDRAAAALRPRLAETLTVDLVSSPGSGKTSLLEATARRLNGIARMGAIVGDIATELDAERLRAAGLPSRQIVTGGACHLDARMVSDALDQVDFTPVDLLFLENVGNLVCPASYDLGEDFKVVLLSVAEGHDKPFKYPGIFAKARITLITKVDLLPQASFDLERAVDQIRTLNPDAGILPVSVVTGQGVDDWCKLLKRELSLKRSVPASA